MKYYITVTAIFIAIYFGRYITSILNNPKPEPGDLKLGVSAVNILIAVILGLGASYFVIDDVLRLGPEFWTTGRFGRGRAHIIGGILYRGPAVIIAPISLLLSAFLYKTHYFFTRNGRGYTFNGKVYRIEWWGTRPLRIYSFLFWAWYKQSRELPVGSFFTFGTPKLMMHLYQYAWDKLDISSQKKLVQYLRRIGKIKSNDISKFDV